VLLIIPVYYLFIGRIFHLDMYDRKILSELQANGRLSVTELADRVGLSLSPCHRRVKALEESGVIGEYRAHLNPSALGLSFSALIFVTMRDGDQIAISRFEEAVNDIPEIIQAQRLFGDPDYLLHVITKNLPAFQQLYDEKLSSLPSIQRLVSTLVMKDLLSDRLLPIL